MSPLPFPNIPLGMPASDLPYVLPPLDTRRARRAQLEVDAALDLSGANSPVGDSFMDATPTGVVFSDEVGGAQTRQGLI
jgi:hypothetical protein